MSVCMAVHAVVVVVAGGGVCVCVLTAKRRVV